MSHNLTKDIVVLLAGVLLTFALESQRVLLEQKFGAERTSLFCFAVFAVLIAGYVVFRHYITLLGAAGNRAGAPHRKAYDNLRLSLSEGGTPARLYARWLDTALHTVERFLGDAGMAKRGLFQRVVGLSKTAPLWTAPALDRCILLAFIYPTPTIFLIWAISGRSGSVEVALGLGPDVTFWWRLAALTGIVIAYFAYWKGQQIARVIRQEYFTARGKSVRASRTRWLVLGVWVVVAALGVALTDNVTGSSSGSVAGSLIAGSAIVAIAAGDVLAGMLAEFGSAIIAALVVWKAGTYAGMMVACMMTGLIGLIVTALIVENKSWQVFRRKIRHSHAFWWLFLAAVIAVCIGIAPLLSHSGAWSLAGPIILYYGLLPALSAPFLWFSLGLTRGLLWLGLERKGWWPYFYALVDAGVAVLIIMILVIVNVVGIQILDMMAKKGGGTPVLSIVPFLDSIKKDPAGPQFWWAYVLLLAAMIPSLVNLTIGGFSLTRGIPVVSHYLHARLPERRAVSAHNRNWIAFILSLQLMTGICLGVAAQLIFLPWWIFGHLLPSLGIGVLQLARRVAVADLPHRIFLPF